MIDRIRYPTVSYLPFYYTFFEIDFLFLLLTIFNLQANILTTKDILSNLVIKYNSHSALLVLLVMNERFYTTITPFLSKRASMSL